jgi:molecular chaperone DnaJ
MSTTKRDYYDVLGVARDASGTDIKSAYRKLAVQYHPDRNPGDASAEEKFKEAAEAYAVLSDGERRARYDRFGHQASGAGGGFSGFDPSVFGDFSDILGDLFGFGDLFGGRRRGRGGGEPGADLQYDLRLTFEEAAFGREVELRVSRLEGCETCGGTGGRTETCRGCSGAGRVRFQQGFFTVAQTCPQCRGEGQRVVDPCSACRGAGRAPREQTIRAKVPAGVHTGLRIRLRGEGEHGRRGGPPGDLHIVLHVDPHERFARDGFDVYEEAKLGYPQLVLGAELEIETLHGGERVRVPAGTEPGYEIRLRDRGIPRLDGYGRGDHVVRIGLAVPHPRDLDEERLELLRRLAELQGDAVSEEGFLDRVKKKLLG